MDNSMDIKINSGNNPIDSLSFLWIAIFSDGTKIEQIDGNGIEHRFQLVKDRFEDLVYFNLTDRKGHLFTVNLINGLIGYNKLEFPYIESKEKKENIRLIYFRRNKITMTESGDQQSHQIWYFLGFQYLDNLGNNRQIVLKIDSEGNWILGE